ncbi:LysR family transcriptional regulator [Afifella sp. H1R]|uniref:LysR family transcriptional regulator n=1 Tax=unclassified Afifella TaxID=2624128 RepID=UPI001F461A82|nr:LysR substrate-binding domain-containing protein [Afifella sp. H1R]MCF1502382.1 LysR substrate-binding domain-containing protein [Afifella sp. H1R]
MNARQLEIFRTIMQTGSVTDAAKLLNVSQPTVSKILHHMEDQLGLRLFRRIRGRLHPTPQAEMLFPDADRVFRDLGALRLLAEELRAGSGGVLRIAASSSLAAAIVPRAIASFRAANPRVKIVSHLLPGAETAEMVRSHQVDLGLCLSPQDLHTLTMRSLGQVEMICIFPRGHRLSALSHVTPPDLTDETFISFNSLNHFGALLDEAFLQYDETRRVDIQATMSIVAAVQVAQGSGVAIVDRFAMLMAPENVDWRPFRPLLSLPINLLLSETLPWSRFRNSMIEHLQKAVEEYLEG